MASRRGTTPAPCASARAGFGGAGGSGWSSAVEDAGAESGYNLRLALAPTGDAMLLSTDAGHVRARASVKGAAWTSRAESADDGGRHGRRHGDGQERRRDGGLDPDRADVRSGHPGVPPPAGPAPQSTGPTTSKSRSRPIPTGDSRWRAWARAPRTTPARWPARSSRASSTTPTSTPTAERRARSLCWWARLGCRASPGSSPIRRTSPGSSTTAASSRYMGWDFATATTTRPISAGRPCSPRARTPDHRRSWPRESKSCTPQSSASAVQEAAIGPILFGGDIPEHRRHPALAMDDAGNAVIVFGTAGVPDTGPVKTVRFFGGRRVGREHVPLFSSPTPVTLTALAAAVAPAGPPSSCTQIQPATGPAQVYARHCSKSTEAVSPLRRPLTPGLGCPRIWLPRTWLPVHCFRQSVLIVASPRDGAWGSRGRTLLSILWAPPATRARDVERRARAGAPTIPIGRRRTRAGAAPTAPEPAPPPEPPPQRSRRRPSRLTCSLLRRSHVGGQHRSRLFLRRRHRRRSRLQHLRHRCARPGARSDGRPRHLDSLGYALALASLRLVPFRTPRFAIALTGRAGRMLVFDHDDGWAAGGEASVVFGIGGGAAIEVGYQLLRLLPASFCADMSSCYLQGLVLGVHFGF